MAHFRGTIQGNRGEASRLGSKAGGLMVTCNGWDDGLRIVAQHGSDGTDEFFVYSNGGSNGRQNKLVGILKRGLFEPAKED